MTTKQINLGKVTLTPRGEFSADYVYERFDIISYEGNSWLVLNSFEGIEPGVENEHVMLLAAKGETGKALTFDDLTPEQQQALRGEKGEQGKGFVVLGHYETLPDLETDIESPETGDAYAVGEVSPYDIYIYDAVGECWINNGKLQGPAGRSVYEIAVDAGFEGTEEEWLELLQPDLDQLALKEELLPIREELEDLTVRFNHTTEEVTQRMETIEEEYATKEEVQEKIDLFGRVFRLRGTVESEEELTFIEEPADGDVVLVKIDSADESNKFKGYVYIEEEAKWELIGSTSLDDIYTKEEIDRQLDECAKINETRPFVTTENITGKQLKAENEILSGGKIHTADGVAGCVLNNYGLYVERGGQTTTGTGLRLLTDGIPTSSILEEINANRLTYSTNREYHYFAGAPVSANNGLQWNGIQIPANSDLNDYYLPGFYCVNMSVNAATLSNCPTNEAFHLEVYRSAFENIEGKPQYGCHQILRTYSPFIGNNHSSGAMLQVWYRNIYSQHIGKWYRAPLAYETPQFGSYATITGFDNVIELSTYDFRFTYAGGTVTTSIKGFSSGIDGAEYVLTVSCINASGNLTISLPNTGIYQSNVDTITIPAGEVGEIFVKYIFGKYIIRV